MNAGNEVCASGESCDLFDVNVGVVYNLHYPGGDYYERGDVEKDLSF